MRLIFLIILVFSLQAFSLNEKPLVFPRNWNHAQGALLIEVSDGIALVEDARNRQRFSLPVEDLFFLNPEATLNATRAGTTVEYIHPDTAEVRSARLLRVFANGYVMLEDVNPRTLPENLARASSNSPFRRGVSQEVQRMVYLPETSTTSCTNAFL